MRILALGAALPDAQIDNYDWARALSFFDYDALVVDPANAVSRFVEGLTAQGASYETYTDEPVQEGPTTATVTGLADLLRRRRDETERYLARGGLIVCFAYPDVPHPHVAGFTGCHRYYWLPAPTGCSYGEPFVKPATGVEVTPTDYEHPFAEFLESFRSSVLYRAVFAEGASGFGEQARVFGRSRGGAAIAIDLRVGGGRIVFLPAMPERVTMSDRATVAGSLVSCIRNALLLEAEESPPYWLSDYQLPGLEEAQKHVTAAEEKLESLESDLQDAQTELRGLERYRRIIWQEGKFGLDLPVRDALVLLGFTAFSRIDDPAEFYFEGERVLVETEGSVGAIGMDPHYRLRQRLERRIADEARRPRGVIVINGQRMTAPGQRPQQYEDSLRVAAESMRYAVVESTRLFEAVQAALSGESESAAAFAKKLLETEGVFTDEKQEEEGS